MILSKNAVEADAIARTIRANGGTADIAATVPQAASLADGCDVLLVDAAMEESDGRLLKRLRLERLFRLRSRHADSADRPRHAWRVPRQRLRDLPGPAGARRNTFACPFDQPCTGARPATAGKARRARRFAPRATASRACPC